MYHIGTSQGVTERTPKVTLASNVHSRWGYVLSFNGHRAVSTLKKEKTIMVLASSNNAVSLREEIGMAEVAYANFLQTGQTSGMSPHEMRDFIEVRENQLRSL